MILTRLYSHYHPTLHTKICMYNEHSYTVRFIKPYLNPVYKCTGHRQDFMKWALHTQFYKYLDGA